MPAPPLTRATFLRFPPASGFGGPMRQAPQQPAGASGGGRRAAGPQPPSPARFCSLRSWALAGNSLPPASLRVGIARVRETGDRGDRIPHPGWGGLGSVQPLRLSVAGGGHAEPTAPSAHPRVSPPPGLGAAGHPPRRGAAGRPDPQGGRRGAASREDLLWDPLFSNLGGAWALACRQGWGLLAHRCFVKGSIRERGLEVWKVLVFYRRKISNKPSFPPQ